MHARQPGAAAREQLQSDRHGGLTSLAAALALFEAIVRCNLSSTVFIGGTSAAPCVTRVRHSVAIFGQLLLFCDQSMREKDWRSRKRRSLLAGAASELAGATRLRQARPSSACTFSVCHTPFQRPVGKEYPSRTRARSAPPSVRSNAPEW